MSGTPRAFRAVLLLLGCWTAARAMILGWPAGPTPENLHKAPAIAVAQASKLDTALSKSALAADHLKPVLGLKSSSPRPARISFGGRTPARFTSFVPDAKFTVAVPPQRGAILPAPDMSDYRRLPASPPIDAAVTRSMWTISSWALYRPGIGSRALAPAGQLGGSQAGARVSARFFELAPGFTAGPTIRISSALSGPLQREVAAGMSLRIEEPFSVELVAERRFALSKNTAGGLALLTATGIDDRPLPAGFTLSGYAQAGIVGLKRRDRFVDGAIRAERPIYKVEGVEVRAGLNAWGAAQRNAARLDAGPGLSARVEMAGQPMRIAVEWRQRLAGNAAPGSGPAVTVGADF